MSWITDVDTLESLYADVSTLAIRKVAPQMTPMYKRWIDASRYCVLATVGPEGTDASPRGDDGPVVEIPDPNTLLMPDWRGNNRLDSLRNIVRDGRVSLMFMVAGSDIVVRINGMARISADPTHCARFEQRGKHPATVIVIKPAEVYAQCPKAHVRADIWNRDDSAGLPTLGDMLQEMTSGEYAAKDLDAAFPARMQETLW